MDIQAKSKQVIIQKWKSNENEDIKWPRRERVHFLGLTT